MIELIDVEPLPAHQSVLVRELFDAFTVFKESNQASLPLDQTKHSDVVAKAVALFAEFPEVAALAKECHHDLDKEPDELDTDLDAFLFWLFLSLYDFADTTDTEKLENNCVYLESHILDVFEFCMVE